jgi:hypothetical protein
MITDFEQTGTDATTVQLINRYGLHWPIGFEGADTSG